MGFVGCSAHHSLVLVAQAVEGLVVDIEGQVQRAFPPAGVVVERCDLVQAQLQIVVGANPLGRIDRAFFQRLIDFASRNVLGHCAHFFQHLARKATHAELQALDVFRRLDFLAEPAPHLRPRIATDQRHDVVLVVELAHELAAIAIDHPRGQLARVHAKRNRTANGKHLVLAKEVVRRGVGHFHSAALHTVDHVECWHQLTRLVNGHIKFASGHGLDRLGKHFGRAVNRVQRFGEAGCNTPANSRLCVHRWGCCCSHNAGDTGMLEHGTTIHFEVSFWARKKNSLLHRFWDGLAGKKAGMRCHSHPGFI